MERVYIFSNSRVHVCRCNLREKCFRHTFISIEEDGIHYSRYDQPALEASSAQRDSDGSISVV